MSKAFTTSQNCSTDAPACPTSTLPGLLVGSPTELPMSVWVQYVRKEVSKEELARRIHQVDDAHKVWARSAQFRDDEDLAVRQLVWDLITILYLAHQNAVPELVEMDWSIKCEFIHTGQVELVEFCRNRPCRRRHSILHLEHLFPKRRESCKIITDR